MPSENYSSDETCKEYIQKLGKELVATNGKYKYYTFEEVNDAHRKISNDEGIPWAAMSIFCTAETFEEIRLKFEGGESYEENRQSIFLEIFPDLLLNWGNFEMESWDFSWLDIGNVFEGAGDFVGSIIGGILEIF